MLNVIVIVVSVALSAAVVAWFFLTRNHPESASSHEAPDTVTESEQLYGKADRPAGPDAEVMDPGLVGGDQDPP